MRSCDDSPYKWEVSQLLHHLRGNHRTVISAPSRSKRHKSGSMEEDVDTSPGGDYYTSPNSPTSSSRNWTEDIEGGKTRGTVRTHAPVAGAKLTLQGLQGVVVQPCVTLL